MEQSTPYLTRDENLAAYVMPVSRWTHFRTVANNPLKKKKIVNFGLGHPVHMIFCIQTSNGKTLP